MCVNKRFVLVRKSIEFVTCVGLNTIGSLMANIIPMGINPCSYFHWHSHITRNSVFARTPENFLRTIPMIRGSNHNAIYKMTDQFSQCLPIALNEDSFYYYPPIYAWVFQVISFPQVSPPKSCMRLSCPSHVLHCS